MRFSDAYARYETMLRELHDLNAIDALDSSDADAIRERMDEEWKTLSSEEKALLRGLSADLYSLTNEEIGPSEAHVNKSHLLKAAQEAYEAGDWLVLLETLRAIRDEFPRSVVAYMRGRCWRELNRPEPAYWFFDLAHKLDPSQPNYELLSLDAMFRSTRKQQAVQMAGSILRSQQSLPHVVFGAAKLLFEIAANCPQAQAEDLYKEIAEALRLKLEQIGQDHTLNVIPSPMLAARLNLAIAYERLGKTDKARNEYDRLVSDYPAQDDIIVARAMFLLEIAPDSAYRDLNELIKRGTSSVYPYFFLANLALIDGRHKRCIELCEQVLQKTTQNRLRAHAFEWMAISAYAIGTPIEAARQMLKEAAYLSPLEESIVKNLKLFEELMGRPRRDVSDVGFELSQPMQPSDVMLHIQDRFSLAPAYS